MGESRLFVGTPLQGRSCGRRNVGGCLLVLEYRTFMNRRTRRQQSTHNTSNLTRSHSHSHLTNTGKPMKE